MRVLVVGGAGFVGRMVLPHLAERHQLHVVDLVEPPSGPWRHTVQDVSQVGALDTVLAGGEGAEALLYMAMNTQRDWESASTAANAFDINVKALYLVLRAAGEHGVRHAVYASSLSVYAERERYPDEREPADATDFYGLTKRLGEEVCRAWVAASAPGETARTVTALRLCFPVADEAPAPSEPKFKATTFTRAQDVARAMLAALEYRSGYDVFAISGDVAGSMVSVSKARQLLGWHPLRPAGAEPAR
jgi:nucleoside-diphosphate-sugar epimerase